MDGLRKWIALLGILSAPAVHAVTREEVEQKFDADQAVYDQRCEAARLVILEPVRAKAFEECMSDHTITRTEEQCHNRAQAYDGQNTKYGLRFYDLPACREAFDHRSLNTRRNP